MRDIAQLLLLVALSGAAVTCLGAGVARTLRSVILPIIAALSVTSEWTQRTGLATFTLVPHRVRVLLGKAAGSVLVALVATLVAFVVAALGTVVASRLAGIEPVWDVDAASLVAFGSAIELLLLTDFTPLLEAADVHRPDLGVVLTDLEGPARFRPRWPVIWAVPASHSGVSSQAPTVGHAHPAPRAHT